MAGQKPAAKRSARPPPPPPAASSSEETDSRSRSEESEDEETVAVSPTPAPSKLPPPQQKGNESESSDEEEEGDDEDEEEEAPNKPPAPPRKDEESESSDDEEEGDDEDEEEPRNKPPAPPRKDEESESSDDEEEGDEGEEEPTHLAAPSAPKKQPPPPQQSKESVVSDEEGEEGQSSESDEEAPPPLPPLKQELEEIKPPPAKKARLAFHRIWSIEDEIRILEALAAHQKQHGALPQPDALIGALAGKLDNRAYDTKVLQSKLQSLKKRYVVLRNRGELPSNEHDRRLLDLSKIVWGGDRTTVSAAAAKAAGSGHELKGFEKMCELYPYLAEEVKKQEAAHPAMFKRVFGKINDDKAHAMDEKIKKQRLAQMKVELRSTELTKEVTKAIMELVD